jgi:hypothetical protein
VRPYQQQESVKRATKIEKSVPSDWRDQIFFEDRGGKITVDAGLHPDGSTLTCLLFTLSPALDAATGR